MTDLFFPKQLDMLSSVLFFIMAILAYPEIRRMWDEEGIQTERKRIFTVIALGIMIIGIPLMLFLSVFSWGTDAVTTSVNITMRWVMFSLAVLGVLYFSVILLRKAL